MTKIKKSYPTPDGLQDCTLVRSTYHHTLELISWAELAEYIRNDELLAQNTDYCRNLLAQNDRQAYTTSKAQCGAFIPAAQFSGGRKREHITALTGVSMVDFDHVPLDRMQATLSLITADPHTFMAYTTTSGHGLRVLFRYSSTQPEIAYLDAWRWGNEYYAMQTNLPYDKQTSDPTRLSFLCHDAALYFNPHATPFRIITSHEAIEHLSQIDPQVPTGTECATLAADIADRQIPFVEGNRHGNLRYRAFLMNKMGCSATDIAQALEPHAPRGHKEAADLAQWVSTHATSDFGTWQAAPKGHHKSQSLAQSVSASTPKNSKSATPEEIRDYLVSNRLLRYNVISALVEVWSHEENAFVDINDRTANSIWHNANLALGKYVKPQDFDKELNSDAVEAFNPFECYFSALPPWDGTDHIGQLAARVHTTSDPAMFSTCFRKWFVGMVASWLTPQVLNQNILTFIGGQGIFKSTFFRRLLPPELNRYFLAKGNSTYVSKDDKLAVTNYALVDFEEIDSMKDADLNAVKALVTTETISERAPYAHNRENRAHLASFCATGNNRSFLTDLSGNRRWLPFEVLSIDSPYLNPVPYEQLYAQAKHLVDSGFQYWFSREQDEVLESHKNGFTEPCIEEEQLLRYYRKATATDVGQFLTTTEIVARCAADLRGQLSTKKMGQVLKNQGFKMRAIHGKRGYIVVPRTYEEISMDSINTATDLLRQERALNALDRQLTIPD